MTPTAIDFFDQAKARSLHKLDIYGGYLQPLVYKWGRIAGPRRPGKHIWIVDGFAGTGRYELDNEGRTRDGSPLIAAKWAREIALKWHYPLVRCINVERDKDCYFELERNTAPWREDLIINLRGEFADHLDGVLDTIDADPALVFLDPFGVNGIEMDVLQRILARAGKTELLIHFSDKTFMRMAGHLGENDERLPVGQKLAESKLAHLDAVIGSRLWRRLWGPGPVDTYTAMAQTVELYLSELRTRVSYAHQIPMRDTYDTRPAYRLVFGTNSAHGVELMSHLAWRYEERLREAHEAGAATLFAEQEQRQHLTDLRDAVYAAGIRRGVASREELIHELVPRLFAQYSTTDYAKVIRELVGLGYIQRDGATKIEPREPLVFVEPAQGSLLGLSS